MTAERRCSFDDFVENYAPVLSSTAFKLYVALAMMAEDETQTCSATREELAKKIGAKSSRTIDTCSVELAKHGLIAWKRTGRENSYTLLEIAQQTTLAD
jgi:hypothetical protein